MPDDFYQDPISDFSQGDIFEIAPNCSLDPPLRAFHDAEPPRIESIGVGDLSGCQHLISKHHPARALLVNYDCEIAKPSTKRWIVCPVVALSDLPDADRGNAKRYRIAHMFFLPRHGAALPDSVAIINHQTTVTRDLLSASNRLATLSVGGRLAFYAQFIRWLSRWELREIQCPKCGTNFNPSMSLPVRAPNDP